MKSVESVETWSLKYLKQRHPSKAKVNGKTCIMLMCREIIIIIMEELQREFSTTSFDEETGCNTNQHTWDRGGGRTKIENSAFLVF